MYNLDTLLGNKAFMGKTKNGRRVSVLEYILVIIVIFVVRYFIRYCDKFSPKNMYFMSVNRLCMEVDDVVRTLSKPHDNDNSMLVKEIREKYLKVQNELSNDKSMIYVADEIVGLSSKYLDAYHDSQSDIYSGLRDTESAYNIAIKYYRKAKF